MELERNDTIYPEMSSYPHENGRYVLRDLCDGRVVIRWI